MSLTLLDKKCLLIICAIASLASCKKTNATKMGLTLKSAMPLQTSVFPQLSPKTAIWLAIFTSTIHPHNNAGIYAAIRPAWATGSASLITARLQPDSARQTRCTTSQVTVLCRLHQCFATISNVWVMVFVLVAIATLLKEFARQTILGLTRLRVRWRNSVRVTTAVRKVSAKSTTPLRKDYLTTLPSWLLLH